MKYSYNWLRELSGTKISAEKTAELLTMRSFELESVKKFEAGLDKVVVGKILGIKKHPNADKLQLVRVDIGKNKLNIVCGAANIKTGDKVPVAQIGAKLSNGLIIKKANICGEDSEGMLCAEDELGIGRDHSGIMILDKQVRIGLNMAEYLNLNDIILDIKVLPDRSHDALSHVGVAREIAVLTGQKLDYDFNGLSLPNKKSQKLKVEIKDQKLCPRYIGAVMENVEIKPSPIWMKARLTVAGLRPINNVVDATNYVMLELGHPLHAFDLKKISDKISKATIIVRRAKKGETMMLLDKSELKLSENDLLITSGETPLALAGIMGGKNSGISKDTKTIVIESANFNPVSIRKSRMAHNLNTEASNRYEKSLDPNLAGKALARVIEILERTAGAKLEGITDVYPGKIKPWKIKLDLNYVKNLLGENVPRDAILKIFNLLELKTSGKGDIITVEIPTYRIDLKTQENLIEEVGRIWGYDRIKTRPQTEAVISADMNEALNFEKQIKNKISSLGFDEMYNYSFYSQADADACGLGRIAHLELKNPMNPNQKYIRISLAPNILKNIHENLKNFESFKIFEIGKAYLPVKTLPDEKRMLVMAEVLEQDKRADTFYRLKGVVEDFLENLGVSKIEFLAASKKNSFWHPARTAEIKIGNQSVGQIGEINPLVLSRFKIDKRVAIAEFDLEKLRAVQKEKIYQPMAKFPIVRRDISFLIKKEISAAGISDFIREKGGELVLKAELFDLFKKDGQASLAFHIEFSARRTLNSQEVDAVMNKIIAALEKDLGVEIRK